MMIIIVFLIISFLNSQLFLKIFYPRPHKEIVEDVSKKFSIDSYLVFSVIKVESKFNVKAESAKGARGLMQVLPDTGIWIAGELNYRDFDPDLLYEPEYNIAIGAWYLQYLIKQFDGNLIAALAAYNGGETNVKKWLANGVWSGEFADLQKIPFKETRNYVYKVIMDYKTYQDLYREQGSETNLLPDSNR
ncbi:MAG: lytic transglycosylase domain-containing protein [Peptococcaceae bacterium]